MSSADDLVKFCGVARKSDQFLGNYQRALDEDRVRNEVAPFFQNPENSCPTAIVLSLHETPLCTIEFEDLVSPITGNTTQPRSLKLRYIRPEDLDRSVILEAAKQFLDSRLSSDEPLSNDSLSDQANGEAEASEVQEDATDASDATDESEDQVDSEEDETPVELGQSILRELRLSLDDPSKITPDLYDVLRDLLKPALVIDGQHRLFGAAKVEENIPLLVCSLVEPSWKEQVFQFTVINDKAKGIPKPFITSLAGMSLTPVELNQLSTRLSQAGIKLWEVDVMNRIGQDPESPFYRLIDFNTGGGPGKGLGYQTMKRVAKVWYEAKPVGLMTIVKKLYADPGSKAPNRKTLVSKWQGDLVWFEFFNAFWSRVKDKFAAKDLWKLHSSLMIAVVLEQFQFSFFKYLRQTAELAFENIEESDPGVRHDKVMAKFKELVDRQLKKFDSKNFEKEWQIKSLNHKEGKALLESYFDNIVDGKSVANHPLVQSI